MLVTTPFFCIFMLNLLFMKETYLHYLWRQKRLPFHLLTLKDGRHFRVLSPGFYNAHNAGPDFREARIEIDGVIWVGPVEIHLRSSDWLRHNHQKDHAYNTVILHVVLEDDLPVVQNGIPLPVLEIGSVIDVNHYRQFLRFLSKMSTLLPCESFLPDVDPVFIQGMIDKCAVERMERKYNELVQFADPSKATETFYRLLARAFGTKHNAAGFEELAVRLPYSSIRQLSLVQKKMSFQVVSGLSENGRNLDERDFAKLSSAKASESVSRMHCSAWNYGGVRPSALPHLRMQQFVALIQYIDLDFFLSDLALKQIVDCFDELVFRINKKEHQKHLRISRALKEQLLINAVSPFLFWWGKVNENPILQENALELLSEVPPEDNRLIREWRKRGVSISSARDSQALIELLQQYCMRKKCLSCSVGIKVLNK